MAWIGNVVYSVAVPCGFRKRASGYVWKNHRTSASRPRTSAVVRNMWIRPIWLMSLKK
jgi:hypothetical protein